MNSKAKGSRNEHRSIAILEAAGYRCTRSSASLGVFDVIAIGALDIILLQVKTRDWPGSMEMESIKLFKAPANCRRIIHRWRDRQAAPDVREV
jgi:Holliday junction resolvase